jgi:VanZ family protein
MASAFALAMAIIPHPPHIPGEPNDKIEHIAAFLTLGLMSAWAYPGTLLLQLLIRLSLFGAVIELIQAIPSLNRDSDPVDWIADTLAAAVALGIAAWLRARAKSRD